MPYDFDAEVEEMRLTLKERKLYKLLRAETKPISREEIHNILWRDCCVCESNLRVQIHNLNRL